MGKFAELIYDIGRLLEAYWLRYLVGVRNTLIVAIVATLVGCIIGLVCGILNTIPYTRQDHPAKRFFLKLIRAVVRIYVEVFRGTPMVLQAVFIYYGIPYFFEKATIFRGNSGIWIAALLVVSINTGAYMAESVRGGIISIDPGQTEGAKAIGMTHVQTMMSVILPQTLRNILPQIGNNLIINIKDTCVLSVISVVELFFVHKGVAGALYTYFESATIAMDIYLTMTLVCAKLLRWWEKKMDGSDNYDLATTDTLAHTTGMYNYPGQGSPYDEKSKEYDQKRGAEHV